ncbi:MAG: FHA domain-containing protein [Planctomycetes bacterium]|nr:FHA domain-containing protein [Planctomycetota bacterium]
MPHIIINESGNETRIEVEKPIRIGRELDNDVTLNEARCSRKHCVIDFQPGLGFTIVDLGSSNGTLLNGERITKTVVSHGDIAEIGLVKIFFYELEKSKPVWEAGGVGAPSHAAQTIVDEPDDDIVDMNEALAGAADFGRLSGSGALKEPADHGGGFDFTGDDDDADVVQLSDAVVAQPKKSTRDEPPPPKKKKTKPVMDHSAGELRFDDESSSDIRPKKKAEEIPPKPERNVTQKMPALNQSGPMTPRIEVIRGPGEGREQLLNRNLDANFIGSSDENQVRVRDKSVDPIHCMIRTEGTRYIISDYGTALGTYVNGKFLITGKEVTLEHGSVIRVGEVALKFLLFGKPKLQEESDEPKKKTGGFFGFGGGKKKKG